MVIRSADEMENILKTPPIKDRAQTDYDGAISDAAAQAKKKVPPVLGTDKVVYRITVSALSLVALVAIVGAVYLSVIKVTTVPDIITALGAGAVGALAGLLAPSPAGNG
ncbi:MAG: hypothetical protein P4L50_24485 [Anaerolineaceae bacterium]|nr:hypothetical protein [Anaerolineaceae bacterium]